MFIKWVLSVHKDCERNIHRTKVVRWIFHTVQEHIQQQPNLQILCSGLFSAVVFPLLPVTAVQSLQWEDYRTEQPLAYERLLRVRGCFPSSSHLGIPVYSHAPICILDALLISCASWLLWHVRTCCHQGRCLRCFVWGGDSLSANKTR